MNKEEESKQQIPAMEKAQEQVPAQKSMSIVDIQQEIDQQRQNDANVYCKKCHHIICTKDEYTEHNVNYNPKHDFSVKKKVKDMKQQGEKIPKKGCTSFFFAEPLKWMEPEKMVDLSGIIRCAKCKSIIGSYKHAGAQCSCGLWICPSFQIGLNSFNFFFPNNSQIMNKCFKSQKVDSVFFSKYSFLKFHFSIYLTQKKNSKTDFYFDA